MKTKLLFLLFLASVSSFAQYTSIPDVNFEKKLIALGIDSGTADGKVLTASISSLTTLDVSSSSILNLTGIQDFVALDRLNCSYNQLTSLDVSKNVALTYLYCSTNKVTTLDVSKNTVLEQLNCNDNKLTILDVSKNLELNTLECNYNQLIYLDVSKNTSLSTLNCFVNQLTTLDVSKNTALINLACGRNQLTALDVSKNIALINLACDRNNLTVLDVSKNTALSTLNCSVNQLTALDVSKNIALTYLICNINQLTTLDVSKNTVLVVLYCDSNKLTSLNIKNGNNVNFQVNNFTKNPDLSCIQVDNVAYANANWGAKKDATAGYTTDCSLQYTLIPDVNFENKLIALGIDTDGANGRVLTANVSTVTSLGVSWNFIKDLTGIQDFVALTYLDCSSNQLKTLDVSKNTALKRLECDGNQLKTLNISKNTALTYLDCSNNDLVSLDVSKNTTLTNLYCGTNQLTNLDVFENTALTILDCHSNQLTSLDVSKNTALPYLSCFDNKLVSLDVSKNIALTTLRCDNNRLTTLDVSKNTALTILDCHSNQLATLNLKNGKNDKLDYNNLNFKDNPTLACIQVDNAANSNYNWVFVKDDTASYYDAGCPSYTLIPDVNFEKKLIALGIDTDGVKGKVLTANVSSETYLDVSSSSISDLTGIQDFVALTSLLCYSNQLTALDVSKNIALMNLVCNSNKLTSLDVSKNTNLIEFTCNSNQLTTLDVSSDIALGYLNCSSNQLTSLNLKNGNNDRLVSFSDFTNNPNLICIQVDDVTYSNANWSTNKDATASYSENCPSLGTVETVFNTISVYPNPTKGEVHIDNVVLEKATLYDALGKLVKTTKFTEGSNKNTINLAGLPKGIYYIYLESQGATTVKKIVVE